MEHKSNQTASITPFQPSMLQYSAQSCKSVHLISRRGTDINSVGAEASQQRDEATSSTLGAIKTDFSYQVEQHFNAVISNLASTQNVLLAQGTQTHTSMQRFTEGCAQDLSKKMTMLGDSITARLLDQAIDASRLKSQIDTLRSAQENLVRKLQSDKSNTARQCSFLGTRLISFANHMIQSLYATRRRIESLPTELRQRRDFSVLTGPADRTWAKWSALLKFQPSMTHQANSDSVDLQRAASKAAILMVTCIFCGHQTSRRSIQSLLSHVAGDPILASFVILAVCFFWQCNPKVSLPPLVGTNHTVRGLDPFESWPRLSDYFKLAKELPSVYRRTGTLYLMSNADASGIVHVGHTFRSASDRLHVWNRHCRGRHELVFSIVGVRDCWFAKRLITEELRLSCIHPYCQGCRRVHRRYEIDFRFAQKVVYRIVELVQDLVARIDQKDEDSQ